MSALAAALVAGLMGYLLGCISTGYYVVRWRTGRDLRTIGSGSTGGRNAGRVLGRRWFLVIGAGDLAKAALGVGLPLWLGLGPWAVGAAMVGVTAGHIWPVQLGFRGGKGIAPVVGTTTLAAPLALLGAALAGVLFVALSRRIHVGGLAGLALIPFIAFALHASVGVALGSLVSVALVVVAHLPNLRSEAAGPASLRLPPWPRRGDA